MDAFRGDEEAALCREILCLFRVCLAGLRNRSSESGSCSRSASYSARAGPARKARSRRSAAVNAVNAVNKANVPRDHRIAREGLRGTSRVQGLQRRLQPAGDVREHRRLAQAASDRRASPATDTWAASTRMMPQRRLHEPAADWRRRCAAAGHHDLRERHRPGHFARGRRAPSSRRPGATSWTAICRSSARRPRAGPSRLARRRQMLVVEQPGQRRGTTLTVTVTK